MRMRPLDLPLATWDHDRVMALHNGAVAVPGVTLQSHIHPTSKLFPWAVREARFDITEMSISSDVLQLSHDGSDYTAIPAFVSRAFRHGGFFARAGSGINSPADFAGRRIGVPEYQMTAALWVRGILADEYGVDCDGSHWRTGALDEGVRREWLDLALPVGVMVEPIIEGNTLEKMLLRREIDGLLTPKPPKAFLDGIADIVRLIPGFEAVEQACHRKTGFFPIMHLIGIRKGIANTNPDLPRALYEGFVNARDIAMAWLRSVWLGNANRLSLPWPNAALKRTLASMGPHYWSYGCT